VVALEIDPVWAARLRERFGAHQNVAVVQADVLRFEWPRGPFAVVGNIPFGITTAFLHRLLDDLRLGLTRADLIVQHEVARKRATPGPSTVLGVAWAPWFEFRLVRRIPANAFRPVPAVDAAHMAIEPRASPALDSREQRGYVRFVRAGFARGGLVRAGLRSQLTNNQVRALRSVLPFTEETLCSSLDADAWIALYTAAKPYLSRR
jgi:23S rRNA (adenine-N6)-dimethyltransferase